ncbi:hypothetical protein C5E07_11935, partial [Pseudoclavibacter sp. RFBJ3]
MQTSFCGRTVEVVADARTSSTRPWRWCRFGSCDVTRPPGLMELSRSAIARRPLCPAPRPVSRFMVGGCWSSGSCSSVVRRLMSRELGVSRQCAHRWVVRFRAEGLSGLVDRSSRPRRSPSKTPAEVEARAGSVRSLVIRSGPARGRDRCSGPDDLSDPEPSRGDVASVVEPGDRGLDPRSWIDHEAIPAPHPGGLVHIDVKKLGSIPDRGGGGGGGGAGGGGPARRATPT